MDERQARTRPPSAEDVSGGFVTLAGERYYEIRNVDAMAPFLISLVSNSDHWMFVASNGGLTAGRVSAETALFPYITVDRIYDSTSHTGPKTVMRVHHGDTTRCWEPFNREHDGRYVVRRNLYKNLLGNKLLFEEYNEDLALVFRYSWATSEGYGFVRHAELLNRGDASCRVEMIDGLQNLLPAGTPRFTQSNASYLVDAYKWNELDEATGLGLFTLFSGISDRAEPCESLRATTVFCLGFEQRRVLLSNEQVDAFRRGTAVVRESRKRGIRGAYFVNAAFEVAAGSSRHWQQVANLEQSQADVVQLMQQLGDPAALAATLTRSIADGTDELARIMASSDGFQQAAEENVTAHHYANVVFNVLRGGIVDDQYVVRSRDFAAHVRFFNKPLYERHRGLLDQLPQQLHLSELMATVREQRDLQFERLALEFLPVTFGRRHGDPSRPWNQFAIRLRDEHGNRRLAYEGNWRDIFQNWEALLVSYPEFIETVIAKFVNASTADGYNPYRITNEGIDWEVEEPDDPWSYIGYWGDHQIIYLLKLLELSRQYHPARLGALLRRRVFSYANVPYRIKPFEAIVENAKSTVEYDHELDELIEQRVSRIGADGKLLPDGDRGVYQVNLLEKLLVPLLAKLGNLVVDGGIWLNTQRPEWNDANNALVGQGLSMVTLYYMRRYIAFLQQLLEANPGDVELSREVSQWLEATATALQATRDRLGDGAIDADQRYELLVQLGQAASRHREAVYEPVPFSGIETTELTRVTGLLDDALAAIDHSIRSNQQPSGLYHAYNLLELKSGTAQIDFLYPMLEGQVAVLSSGAIAPNDAITLLEALFDSELFRADQNSFMLYPDRALPSFLEKNRIPPAQVQSIPLLAEMIARGDRRLIERDAAGTYRFNADLRNAGDLEERIDELIPEYGEALESERRPLHALYEQVFHHKAFTGRSGGMFGFEGLGSIYWHMVAKLLLAVAENFFDAKDQDADAPVRRRLGHLYYRIREGIGFNKTPAEYGAFPTDPYSHTPRHAGAQQPGMTGQVKEELLARLAELGLRVFDGAVHFDPALLRAREFAEQPQQLRFLDVDDQWQTLPLPAGSLAFTLCQVPFVYRLDDSTSPGVELWNQDGERSSATGLSLSPETAAQIFARSGEVRRVELTLNSGQLLAE